ncbi:zinc finger protein 502-like [Sitodiplosis mosellana]|uniref:zinc finger protein 502-like n=1 Tax=Sitodiplosis mosellana TaxID=263140 RepID=UPI0024448D8F|nr:zinc finger protein 502-like [Sitodiplosis mosellana]
MGKKTACRICDSKYAPNFSNLFHSNVKVYENENHQISYFEAMQQLTGIEIEYGENVSNYICFDCQSRVKLAYKIRGELIKALEVKKKKKTIQVYQLITKSDPNDGKSIDDGSGVHEELVEIATIEEDDYNDTEATEQIYVEETKAEEDEEDEEDDEYLHLNEHETELITDEPNAEEEPLDAVSFLLEKKELFKSDPNAGKKSRRSHKCEVCEKTFMRKSNLVDHLRLHANVRLYKCEYCGKEFVQAGNYRSHLRIHTKERPYKCSMCPKTYNQSSALKVHIRSHTNEKNYVCNTCNKGFTNSSDLNKHIRVHDPSLKVKCEHCDKTFAQRVNLKNHILRHHNTKAKKVAKTT